MTQAVPTPEQLLSELTTDALRKFSGSVGVIVRDVISPDPKTLLQQLIAMHDEARFPSLRIAYLRPGGEQAAQDVGIGDDLFSIEVEQAERWRNERDLKALIVVVARGDEAKLSSLEDFDSITSQNLKNALVDRAMAGPAGKNDAQRFLWEMLAKDDLIGLGQLVDYYLALSQKDTQEFKTASWSELYRVGLLPDRSLFDDAKRAAMRKRLQSNRELVERLQLLTPRDRLTIKQVVETETNRTKKEKLRKALDQLHRTRSTGAKGAIDYEQAQRLIKLRTKPTPVNGRPTPPTKELSRDFASGALLDPSLADDLKQLIRDLEETLDAADATSVRTEKVRTLLSNSQTEIFTTIRLDVLNLIAKVLDDGVYGGLIQINLDDIDDLLRRFNAQEHVTAAWERNDIRDILDGIAGATEGGSVIAERFESYDAARTAILPHLRVLIAEPLVIAAEAEARKKLSEAVESYVQLTHTLREHYDKISEAVGADVDELVGLLLLMDVVVVKGAGRLFAVLSPVHPLFLWHYVKYAALVAEQRDRLDERDKELVAEAASQLPNFLTSLYIPATALGHGRSLDYAGRVGQLPYFADVVQGSASDDGIETISKLFADYLALEPHARHGFRVALVDPPSPGQYLRKMIDLRDEGVLDGAHVVVYRHQSEPLSVELRLDVDDEDRVAQVFRASNLDRRFTFAVRDRRGTEVGPEENEPFHVAVVFDRSAGRTTRARPTAHPIQPLAVPRRISYRTVRKTVELEPAPGGVFDSYYRVVGSIAEGSGQVAYLAVHQQQELRKTLSKLALQVAWTIIADRHVDSDLNIGALRIFTGSEGERDVVAFTRSMDAFRSPLREVARHYNTFITDGELDDLLRQLSDLLDSGLLNVKPDQTGKVNVNQVKGLLATLIAARWYRKAGPSQSRLLVSLDSKDARRWMRLSDDPLRADLVGFEWTNDGCTVSVVEVKSVEAATTEYKIQHGIVSGPAVAQMLATRRLLKTILAKDRTDELIATPARREVLREHFYRELTKGLYSPDDRRVWADRLRRLLDGEVATEVVCHLIDVRLGVDTSTLLDRNVFAEDGADRVPTRVHELNEELIEVPTAREPPTAVEGGPTQGPGERTEAQEPVVFSSIDSGAAVDRPTAASLPSPSATEASETVGQTHLRSTKAIPAITASRERGRTRVLLGTALGPYGKPKEVWFDPSLPSQKLPNPHISITGESGSGKTQATKAIVSELGRQGIPAFILDFKDDYSTDPFLAAERIQLYDASLNHLPLNPLIPPTDARQDLIHSAQHIYQVADIIKRIFKLGDQQAYRLREAIKRAYECAGIPLFPAPLPAGRSFPPFGAVRDHLDGKANEALLGRLSPIFDLGLFAADTGQSNFENFFQRSSVVRLAQLPSDEVKNSVAEFFLMALYNHLVRQPQVHTLERLLVLDEAWRVVESPFLTPLMREGRAFGLGVVIASQFPRDLPETVRGSTATRLFLSQGQVEQIREIQKTIVGKTSGSEAEHVASVVRGLAPFSCVMHSTQYTPFVRVTITPYFRRRLTDNTASALGAS